MENSPSDKTLAFAKNMNMDISVVIIFNEVFIKISSTEINIQKNTIVIEKTFFFMIGLFLTAFFYLP